MDIVIVKELDSSPPQTYIKSQGISQTVVQKPGVNNINQINWDANYNGEVANLNLDINTNGKKDNFVLQLSKGDLENLLNIPSIEKPLEERLEEDFLVKNDFAPSLQYKPQPYLFRPSIYPKTETTSQKQNNIESQIKDVLNEMNAQDDETLKSEINNLLQLKKKLQHPHKGKHAHSYQHKKAKTQTPVKRTHLTKTKKTKNTKKHSYKTPSPKTIRIHLTDDDKTSSSSTTSKRKSRRKRKTSSPKKDTSLLERISDLIQN